MSMFCGLPVIVATLPMFDAVASASRYGTARWPRDSATSIRIGVNTRQIVSFTKSADSTPVVNTTVTSSTAGCLTRTTIARATVLKNRASRRLAMSTIIPKSRMSVRKSIAR